VIESHLDGFLPKGGYFGVQIVTHEIQLLRAIPFGGVNRHFGRRQREDQPSATGIHGGKSQNIAEKCAISLRIPAVYDYMRSKDHAVRFLSIPW
jgi:hypothetical protein